MRGTKGTVLRLERVKRGHKVKEVAQSINYHEHYLSDVELSTRRAGEPLQAALAEFYNIKRERLFDKRGFAI